MTREDLLKTIVADLKHTGKTTSVTARAFLRSSLDPADYLKLDAEARRITETPYIKLKHKKYHENN